MIITTFGGSSMAFSLLHNLNLVGFITERGDIMQHLQFMLMNNPGIIASEPVVITIIIGLVVIVVAAFFFSVAITYFKRIDIKRPSESSESESTKKSKNWFNLIVSIFSLMASIVTITGAIVYLPLGGGLFATPTQTSPISVPYPAPVSPYPAPVSPYPSITFRTNDPSRGFTAFYNEIHGFIEVSEGTTVWWNVERSGNVITIQASTLRSYEFSHWEANSTNVSFDDPFSQTTSFTMPDHDIIITAHLY